LLSSFIDANVFVYAFLKPRRKLQPHEEEIKKAAKEIIARIDEGEEALTSVVHFSEICNILEDSLQLEEAQAIEMDLLFLDNLQIREVSKEYYLRAVATAQDLQIGANDALAYTLMKEAELSRIYSFDKDFDEFKDIQRITE
jgi:predicted nucleic acid-binding protein